MIIENSKWDQPFGEQSDRSVSTLFRVRYAWWPDKLLQDCLGENRSFGKASSAHTQPWSETCTVMPKGRPRHSVWEVCKNIESHLKWFCCVPPLNSGSLLGDPAMMRDFVSQRNWNAYLEHSGTLCLQMSKTQQDIMHQFYHPALSQRDRIPEGLHWSPSKNQQNCWNNQSPEPTPSLNSFLQSPVCGASMNDLTFWELCIFTVLPRVQKTVVISSP